MLQYLLNTSAIWLISLGMFDVFLKKESYHSYNRFYLLLTFLLGALLPLIQWQSNQHVYVTSFGKPMQRFMVVKQNIITVVPAITVSWEKWVTGIYLTGALLAFCILAIDIIKLIALYNKGQKKRQDNWTVIETGKEHAPFSFLHILFVNSRQQYNADEWQMIIAHEKLHSTLYHFADLLLMQTGRILFWFHPLVYVYNKRLLLVHEYQADYASTKQPSEYSKFLVEQAVLRSAPIITHSFNRSSIKKRILMLTHKSSIIARTKKLIFVPLTLFCILCFSKTGFSKKIPNAPSAITVHFGNFDTATVHDRLTMNEILANPRLICSDPDAQIVSYHVVFIAMQAGEKHANGKRDDFTTEAYTMQGAALNNTITGLMEKYKDYHCALAIMGIQLSGRNDYLKKSFLLGYYH